VQISQQRDERNPFAVTMSSFPLRSTYPVKNQAFDNWARVAGVPKPRSLIAFAQLFVFNQLASASIAESSVASLKLRVLGLIFPTSIAARLPVR